MHALQAGWKVGFKVLQQQQFEQKQFEQNKLEQNNLEQKEGITKPQVVAGREFKGTSFISKPEII